MKISKLFHWLYGFLMLLPVFAVGVKCAYVTFNKNAKDSYNGSFKYLSSYNLNTAISESTYINLTYNGNTLYKLTNPIYNNNIKGIAVANSPYENSKPRHTLFCVNDVYVDDTYYQCKFIDIYNRRNATYLRYFTTEFDEATQYLYFNNDAISIKAKSDDSVIDNGTAIAVTNKKIDFSNTQIYIYRLVDSYDYPYFNNMYIYNYYIDTSLSNVFYSSLQELDDVSFFSWARNSFLSAPFMYIGALFGIPDVHPIFTFLSYWCAISIIYLVFDLVMYVPLLAHRWLDKGIIE